MIPTPHLFMAKLSFWQATAVGLGNIVGAGIFVMAGSAIDEAGPSAVIAFLVTKKVSLLPEEMKAFI